MTDHDSEIMNSAMRFLCFQDDSICRLCLRPSNDSQATTVDEICHIKTDYMDEQIPLIDVFFDLEIHMDENLPKTLCANCATIVLNTYLFKRLCKYSNTKWSEILNSIDLNHVKEDNLKPSTRTLFLVLDKPNILYPSKSVASDTKKAVQKINSIVNSRNNVQKHKKTKDFCANISDIDGKGNFLCSYCSKKYSTHTLMQQHMERVHYPKLYQCDLCNKKFGTKQLLRYHNNSNHVPVKCTKCMASLPSKTALKNHMDKHGKTKCDKCGKMYESKASFQSHLKICGDTSRELAFFCDLCNKGYIRKNGLRTHIKVDHGFGKSLQCSWCDKKYDAISKLKLHIVKHTKEKNFHCECCGKSFVTAAALTTHQRLHTGEKPFPCDLCDESFLSASRRMEHKHRKHFGPSKQCPFCQVKFISRFHLKVHIERHSNPQSKLYIMPKLNSTPADDFDESNWNLKEI